LLLDRGEVGGTFRKVMMSRLRRRKLLAGSSSTIPRKFKSMSVARGVELSGFQGQREGGELPRKDFDLAIKQS